MRRFALVLTLLFLVACGSSDPVDPTSDAARFPDEEGVVTSMTRSRMTLDNKRTFDISLEVQSFSSLEGHAPTALVSWRGKYVHAGLTDDKVIWVAGIGLALPNGTVTYVGYFERVEEGRAVFADGTALRFKEG
ncbi:MAG: hypothetical protein ABIS18_06805, partial [Actinomycetota bacterium]